MPQDIQRKRKRLIPLGWNGIAYFTLFGGVTAMLATWALVTREIQYKVQKGVYFHATPKDDPVLYWAYIVFLCVMTVFLWGSTLYSIVQIIRSRCSSGSKKGTAHGVNIIKECR
jgi:hypothetical protein